MPSDWERVAADPALLAAVRARYAGSGDVLDQLWWLEHPGSPTPRGALDPAVAVAAARADLYRPGGARTDARVVERSTAALDADRQQARLALEHAEAEGGRPSAVAAVPPARPALGLLVGGVVAALLLGAGAGFAAGRFTAAPSAAALSVFDRPQRSDDRPPSTASLPTALERSTTRLVGSSTSTGTSVYGARTQDGRVCLVAVVLAYDVVTSCTTDAAFAVSGLSLTFEAAVDPEDDSGGIQHREVDPHWSADGRFTF